MTRGGRFTWYRYWCPIGVGIARSTDGQWAESEGKPILPWLWFKLRMADNKFPGFTVKLGEYMLTFGWVW